MPSYVWEHWELKERELIQENLEQTFFTNQIVTGSRNVILKEGRGAFSSLREHPFREMHASGGCG